MSYSEKIDQENDGRMDTPAFHRNHTHVVELLSAELTLKGGDILEIGSGSGQHALVYAKAFPTHVFWPSDFNQEHVLSIEAWRQSDGTDNLRAPFQLDVTMEDWGISTGGRPPSDLAGIISLNMVHISPITAAEGLFRGAGQYLGAAGKLFLYGPFKKDGEHTAPSNAEFDSWLRNNDPAWGVRDVGEVERIAAQHGLELERAAPMPANNFTLIFKRKS